jgi:hypothetical protein
MSDDDDLKSLYRDLADGRITPEAAAAAEAALHGRRAARQGNEAGERQKPSTRLLRPAKRAKVFGYTYGRVLDRNEAANSGRGRPKPAFSVGSLNH